MRRILWAVALVDWAGVQPAAAQDVAHSFSELRITVESGTHIRVADSSGGTVEGRITNISDTTITLTSETSGPMSFQEPDVRTIDQRRGFRPWAMTAGAIEYTSIDVNVNGEPPPVTLISPSSVVPADVRNRINGGAWP